MESIPDRRENGPRNLYGSIILTLNSSAHVDTLYLSKPKQREYHARVWGLLKSRYDDSPMKDLLKKIIWILQKCLQFRCIFQCFPVVTRPAGALGDPPVSVLDEVALVPGLPVQPPVRVHLEVGVADHHQLERKTTCRFIRSQQNKTPSNDVKN